MATSSPARPSYRVITSHPGICSVSVSAGDLAAVGGEYKAAVYDINSGDRVQRLEQPAGVKTWRPISVTFTPTCVFVGNLASVGEGGGIYSFPTTDLTSRGSRLNLSPAPEYEQLWDIAACITPAGTHYLAVLLRGGPGSLSVYRETSAGVWTSTTRDTVSLYGPLSVDICPDLVVVRHGIQQQQRQDDQRAVTAWEPDTLRRLWSRHGDSQLRRPNAVCIDPDTSRVLVADGGLPSVQVAVLRGSDGTVLAGIPLPGGRGGDRVGGRRLDALGVAGAGRRLLAADRANAELVEVSGWTDLLPPLSPQEQLLPPLSPQEQLPDLLKAKEELEENLATFQKLNLELTEQKKNINDELTKANEKISKLQDEMVRVKTDNNTLAEENKSHKDDLSKANEKFSKLQEELVNVKTANTGLTQEIKSIKELHDRKTKSIEQLEEEVNRYKGDLEAANKDKMKVKAENIEMEKTIHLYHDVKDRMKKDIESLQEEVNRYKVKAALGEEDVRILKKNRLYLLHNLDPDHGDIINYLLQEDVLLDHDCDLIRSKPTKQLKTETLLDILPYRGPKAYTVFRKSLLEHFKFIVDKLDET